MLEIPNASRTTSARSNDRNYIRFQFLTVVISSDFSRFNSPPIPYLLFSVRAIKSASIRMLSVSLLPLPV